MADIVTQQPRVMNLELHESHPQRDAGQINATSLWKGFRARWLRALLAGLILGIGAGVVACVTNPARYHASTIIRVLSAEQPILSNIQVLETDKSPFQKAQPSLVTSRGVLRIAATSDEGRKIAATGNYGDLTSWLERNIKVGYLEDTDLMQVTLSGFNAKETAELLNLVADSYVKEANKVERDQMLQKIEILGNSQFSMQESLRQEKDKLSALAKTLKTGDSAALRSKQLSALDELALVRKDVAWTKAAMRELEVKINNLKARAERPENEVSPYVADQQVENNQAVVKQLLEVQTKEDNFHTAERNSIPGTSAITRARKEAEAARAELEKLRVSSRKRVIDSLAGEAKAKILTELKSVEEEMRIRVGQLKELDAQEKIAQAEVDRIGTNSFELEAKRSEIETAEAMLRKVRDQKQQMEVESQSNQQRIVIKQRAEPPDSKNTRTRDILTTLATLAGLFLGVVGTSFLEVRARRIQSADDVTSELGMNVVGTLPVLPNRRTRGTGTNDGYWGHLVTESVAYIRTVVLSGRGSSRPNQVLMITSAQSQEGKTMLASNLALSIARTGRRTLLVDGDMRRPSVAALFGVPEGPGIAEVLRGEAMPAACIRPTAMPGLVVLPAGRCCRNAVQELAREGIERLFSQLRTEYDFIVVDSCPVLPVSDSLLLGRLVDAVVFCVRPRISRAPSVTAAHDMLRRLHIPVLGTVINGATHHSSGGDYMYLIGENNTTTTSLVHPA